MRAPSGVAANWTSGTVAGDGREGDQGARVSAGRVVAVNGPYTITARRWARGWELFNGADILTQATTLATAAEMARNALATDLGGEPEDYVVEVVVDLGGAEKQVDQAREQMRRAQADVREAARSWRLLALRLREVEHLSARDAAVVLGISSGRYSQLLHDGGAS